MTLVAWIFATVAAVVHFTAFAWESVLFERPKVHRGVFGIPSEDVPPIRLWAFNVGFYNLFLGAGALIGVILWMLGHETVGRTLVIYTSVFMALAGAVLFASDRLELGRPKGSGVTGSLVQSGPPLIALVATLLAG